MNAPAHDGGHTPAAAGHTAPTNGPQTVVSAEGLTRHYRVRSRWWQAPLSVQALNEVSFELSAGETLAVVGESGCGKSTLARQLTMIEAPTAGKLWLAGQDLAQATAAQRRALRPWVQMVFQNPYASLNPRHTVAQALAEPLAINTPLTRAERQDKAAQWLQRVGLRAEHGQRYPHMFSGGQRQRIAIARAMVLQPQVLVADEPVSALDVSIQAQILNLFMDLQDEFGMACVFISHNLSVVEHVAQRVMVMYLGRVVELAPKVRLFAKPLHPYTQALMSATPKLLPSAQAVPLVLRGELPSPLAPPGGCAFHTRCPQAVARCAQEQPAMRDLGSGQQVACHRAEEWA